MPSSPAAVRANTAVASPDQIALSTDTRSTCIVAIVIGPRPDHSLRSGPASTRTAHAARTVLNCSSRLNCASRERSSGVLELVRLALEVLDTTAHEERLLRVLVEIASGETFERLDGLLDRHERSLHARELLGHERVLRQEALDASRPADDDLVLLGEFVDAENRDDVLQFPVTLQDLLGALRDVVVLLADVLRIQDAAGRVEGVHRRVDALLRDRPAQHGRRVE